MTFVKSTYFEFITETAIIFIQCYVQVYSFPIKDISPFENVPLQFT